MPVDPRHLSKDTRDVMLWAYTNTHSPCFLVFEASGQKYISLRDRSLTDAQVTAVLRELSAHGLAYKDPDIASAHCLTKDGAKATEQLTNWIEKRQVGPLEFTLFVVGPADDGRWHWWLNEADTTHTHFGKPIADGTSTTKEDARRAAESAFERHGKAQPNSA